MIKSAHYAIYATCGMMVLISCQATSSVGPNPVPGVSSAVAPTASPLSPSPSPLVTPEIVASPELVILTGKIFDDEQRLVQSSKVELISHSDPSLNRQLDSQGGSYVVSLPLEAVVTLRAYSDGYISRQQTFNVEQVRRETGRYIVDFGGEAPGTAYALSKTPEISEITPGNQASGVSSGPLEVKFRFSHPLSAANQDRVEDILQFKFRAANKDVILQVGTFFDNETADMTWSEDGREGTFRFSAPLVTRDGAAGSVTISFNSDIPYESWPVAGDAIRLGGEAAHLTYEGSGVAVYQKVAVFLGDLEKAKFTSPRPTKLELWGQTHRTTTVFSLAEDKKAPKAMFVKGLRGLNGDKDRIEIEFDEPMRGFPLELMDTSVFNASNYRFVLGNSRTAKAEAEYKATDPEKDGRISPEIPTVTSSRNNVVQLSLPSGTLQDYTHFKIFLAPAIKDLAGNTLADSARDPVTGLADNLLEGTIH